MVGAREHSGYHRFFSRGAWEPERVGLALMEAVLKLLPSGKRVVLSLDDTLARHTGKHISSAGMHRDPLLSCAARPFWHFCHNWIVLAVVVPFPKWGKTFSLPVLVRLYRTKKVNEALGRPHDKLTDLARELLYVVSKKYPKRLRHVCGGESATSARGSSYVLDVTWIRRRSHQGSGARVAAPCRVSGTRRFGTRGGATSRQGSSFGSAPARFRRSRTPLRSIT